MTTWLLLACAIASEVTASLSLKGALDRPALYVVVVIGYVVSFVLLAVVLRRGMALGVAYGVWGALGVASTAVLCLRVAVTGRRAWYVVVVTGYLAAFALLTLTLDAGLALGVAYGIWAATGVALTAIASRVLFKEPLTVVMATGIGLIAAGVLLVELGASH
jgi:small multidrug resistance pump